MGSATSRAGTRASTIARAATTSSTRRRTAFTSTTPSNRSAAAIRNGCSRATGSGSASTRSASKSMRTRQRHRTGKHVDPVSRAQRVPPPDPTRADLVQPHEITAVGIEMLLEEEAHTAEVQQAANLAAASLRLEDEPASARARSGPARPARARRAAAGERGGAARGDPRREGPRPERAETDCDGRARRARVEPASRAARPRRALRRAHRPYRARRSMRSSAARVCPRSRSTTSKSSRRCIASAK